MYQKYFPSAYTSILPVAPERSFGGKNKQPTTEFLGRLTSQRLFLTMTPVARYDVIR